MGPWPLTQPPKAVCVPGWRARGWKNKQDQGAEARGGGWKEVSGVARAPNKALTGARHPTVTPGPPRGGTGLPGLALEQQAAPLLGRTPCASRGWGLRRQPGLGLLSPVRAARACGPSQRHEGRRGRRRSFTGPGAYQQSTAGLGRENGATPGAPGGAERTLQWPKPDDPRRLASRLQMGLVEAAAAAAGTVANSCSSYIFHYTIR